MISLLLAFALLAPDAWDKVKDLKGGSEVRIFKAGVKQPVIGLLEDAEDDRVLLVVKNEQVSIPKRDIERLEARPAKSRVKVQGETKSTEKVAGSSGVSQERMQRNPPQSGGNTSTSTGVTVSGKPEFEVIYRRTAAKPD